MCKLFYNFYLFSFLKVQEKYSKNYETWYLVYLNIEIRPKYKFRKRSNPKNRDKVMKNTLWMRLHKCLLSRNIAIDHSTNTSKHKILCTKKYCLAHWLICSRRKNFQFVVIRLIKPQLKWLVLCPNKVIVRIVVTIGLCLHQFKNKK